MEGIVKSDDNWVPKFRCFECYGTGKVREHPYRGGHARCPECLGDGVLRTTVEDLRVVFGIRYEAGDQIMIDGPPRLGGGIPYHIEDPQGNTKKAGVTRTDLGTNTKPGILLLRVREIAEQIYYR